MDSATHEPIEPMPGKREKFPAIIGPIIQRSMKRGWQLLEEGGDGAEFRNYSLAVGKKKHNAHAILSVSRELDDRAWVHLSLSIIVRTVAIKTPSREIVVLPSWPALCVLRDDFLGPKAKAIIIVATKSEHVNIEEVHHIWHCPEGDGLPDFTRGTGHI